jgi:hypothetical protein
MAVELLPDVEQIVSWYLRNHDDVAELVDEQVYTVFPKQQDKDTPCVLVRRFGGAPAFTRPLVLDRAQLQVDCYGGPKRVAQVIGRTVQAALSELNGVRTNSADEQLGVVTHVDLGAFRDLPDEAWKPPRPRYVLDVTVTVKKVPAGAPAGLSPRVREGGTKWQETMQTTSS